MTTQIVFNIDPKIKAQAMKRAKREGVPFSAVLKMATKAFADGDLSMELTEEIRPEKLKRYERQSRLADQGKGREFVSAREAIAYIDSL